MEQPEFQSLINISFDEFVLVIFERSTSKEAVESQIQFVETELNAEEICAHYVKLFRQPEFLLTRFSKDTLEAGFWAMMGLSREWSLGNIIEYSDASLSSRRECIDSMATLFEKLFAYEPLDTSVHMWWDSLCYSWHCGNRKRERGGDDIDLQDIFFNTLAKVLAIDSWICQGAALHGLRHLHHPDTGLLIDNYLAQHPKLTDEQQGYARAAARFEVL